MCPNQLYGSNLLPQGYFIATKEDLRENMTSAKAQWNTTVSIKEWGGGSEIYSISSWEWSSSEPISLFWIARKQVKVPAG